MCVYIVHCQNTFRKCVGSRFSKFLDTRENIHFILKQHTEFVFSLNVLTSSWPMLRPLLDSMGITPFQPQSCICLLKLHEHSQPTRMSLPRYVGKPPVSPDRPIPAVFSSAIDKCDSAIVSDHMTLCPMVRFSVEGLKLVSANGALHDVALPLLHHSLKWWQDA